MTGDFDFTIPKICILFFEQQGKDIHRFGLFSKMADTKLYDVLGVSKSASDLEIKKASSCSILL